MCEMPAKPSIPHNPILFVANSPWNLLNFRLPVMQAFRDAGYSVAAAAPEENGADTAHARHLRDRGFDFYPVAMSRSGTNPAEDLATLGQLKKLYRTLSPAAVCHFTIKPVIYGSLAARGLPGIRVINNISGLGTVFIKTTPVTLLVKSLYRRALRRADTVFFQNPDDRELFLAFRLAAAEKTALLPGSGVDLERFVPPSEPTPFEAGTGPFRFLLIARMLSDKGITEFARAAALLAGRGKDAEAVLLGGIDTGNRTAISEEELAAWAAEGHIRYFGSAEDVRPEIAAADCVVLPSYREGTPRTLLEAAAMGKPLIATDVPGCRQAVDHGSNGLLCAVRDPESLADAMEEVMALTPEARRAMGAASRRLAEERFDQQLVIDAYLGSGVH
jgi:glycosyltransferase involved in cell wall biosynthesis